MHELVCGIYPGKFASNICLKSRGKKVPLTILLFFIEDALLRKKANEINVYF